MANPEKFTVLRTILRTIGLSDEAIDDIIDRIVDFLSDKDAQPATECQFPYAIRDDFLSPAEHSFYSVLRGAVTDWAVICPKVALGDLFFAKATDPRQFRSYTNKIDRKHVDFLLCDPKTMRPLAGIELDDKSHDREDRQKRDVFVEGVFAAAKLPLIRVLVRSGYEVNALNSLLRQKAGIAKPINQTDERYMPPVHQVPRQPTFALTLAPAPTPVPTTPVAVSAAPVCPKCGANTVLRTAKTGASQGSQFWGCSNFPRCRVIMPFKQ
jgi:hypothetical protein